MEKVLQKYPLSWLDFTLHLFFAQKKIIGREIDVFMWKTISPHINTLEKDYDVAIGYGQYLPSFFVVDKVNAKRRVGYVNTLMSPPESLIDTLQQKFQKSRPHCCRFARCEIFYSQALPISQQPN